MVGMLANLTLDRTRLREGSPAVAFAPLFSLAKLLSARRDGENFPLFSRVMRLGLLTAHGYWAGSTGLSQPIFSPPVNRIRFGKQR
jgi:hypothetical protein